MKYLKYILMVLACLTGVGARSQDIPLARMEIETFKGVKFPNPPLIAWPAFIKEMDYFGFNARDHFFQYLFWLPEVSSRTCYLGQEQAIKRYREAGVRIAPICISQSGIRAEYIWLESTVTFQEFRSNFISQLQSLASKDIKDPSLIISDFGIQDNVHYFRFWNAESKLGGVVGMYILENGKTRRLNMKLGIIASTWYVKERTEAGSFELIKGRLTQFRARMKVHTTVGTVPETPLTLE